MNLVNSFDIFENFYSDSQLKTIFNEEYANKVPSSHMWALVLYSHPESKYYSQLPHSRRLLIEQDYLKHTLKWDEYSETLSKMEDFLLTKPQRLLKGWESKLEERDQFIAALPYNAETYEMLDKMMSSTAKMWDQYFSILKKVSQETDSTSQGDIELSLSEQGLI